MEIVGATASVIGIATLAWQSSKAACDIIDGIAFAPTVLEDSKHCLVETQDILSLLQTQLSAGDRPARQLDNLLGQIRLERSLQLTRGLCDDFHDKLRDYTRHSNESALSKRDRLAIARHEKSIARYNTELRNCQLGLNTVSTSINLILSGQMSTNIEGLVDRFVAQEQALLTVGEQLDESQRSLQSPTTEPESDNDTASQAPRLTAELKEVCDRTHASVKGVRQKFGKMELDETAKGMQGVVGAAQDGLDQSFGDFKAGKEGRGFQGRIDADSFAKLFG